MTVNDSKTLSSPDKKLSEAENGGGTMSGPLVETMTTNTPFGRKSDCIQVTLRLLCTVSSVIALSFMVTAHQTSTFSIYGFKLPVSSKWSFSNSFEYLVGMTAAVAAHSLLQLLIGASRLLKKFPVIPSRTHAWLIFAGDQVFAYALISAGSAASGTTNLNRTGVRHTALPNFCKSLHSFCYHVGFSIAFTFISCVLLAASAVQQVIWLSKSKY
ncbi:RecName: Full CASP-like protein 3A1 Short RcCASPL3A1 [Tripterygium wilfordii]|uniref:CASP-like protein n=1 Tax=Tripterygium wilfordii TaxID=458696 RepID=A0A7J7D5R1_TRIWF|nr:CASP-like protein 3A1 [Tripterygium wilfordii]KAF5741662.1 RecName: Full CASP-like protein 3A1 Short RcCASPL3A1 [Tripterygium wilfordii]